MHICGLVTNKWADAVMVAAIGIRSIEQSALKWPQKVSIGIEKGEKILLSDLSPSKKIFHTLSLDR